MRNRGQPRNGRAYAAALAAGFAVTAMLLAAPAAEASKSDRLSLFGTMEIRSNNLEKFKQWTGMLERYSEEEPAELDKCQVTATEKCHVARWRIYLKQIADRPPREQLDLVNAYLNRWTYVLDPVNYGVRDYWATPRQFLYRDGDCEDYAIAKYASLLHLGFPKDSMRILVLQDMNLDVPHAVLIVDFEGEALMLDNQISQVIPASRVTHYKPIYSINETAWWLHRVP